LALFTFGAEEAEGYGEVSIDLAGRTLRIAGKGQKERVMDLEKKAMVALKSHLAVRPASTDTHLFLNYQRQGLSDWGVKKVVERYRELAGIQKKIIQSGTRRLGLSVERVAGV
jgi:site-specific recombinase XerD